jgi:hypothetical protein
MVEKAEANRPDDDLARDLYTTAVISMANIGLTALRDGLQDVGSHMPTSMFFLLMVGPHPQNRHDLGHRNDVSAVGAEG